jgi:hypothetical protein
VVPVDRIVTVPCILICEDGCVLYLQVNCSFCNQIATTNFSLYCDGSAFACVRLA